MTFKIAATATGYIGQGKDRKYLVDIPVVLTLQQKTTDQGYETDDLEIDYDRV